MLLFGRWSGLAQGHLGLTSNCGCCDEYGSTNVKKMEQPILDYLDRKYRKAGSDNLNRLLAEQGGFRPGEAGSIADVLRFIAKRSGSCATEEEQLRLIADLERSMDSLAAMS